MILKLKCPGEQFSPTITYTQFLAEKLRPLCKIYDTTVEDLLCKIAFPSSYYYVRVNTLKASAESVINSLRDDGYSFYSDGKFAEAIYSKVEGPFPIDNFSESYVVVDRFTAESVVIGANVYAPGSLKIKGKIGDRVAVLDPLGNVVGLGKLVNNPLKVGARRGLVVNIERSTFKAPKVRESKAFLEGMIFDQSYPSMMVSRSLDIVSDDIVIDLTASPGGKITHAYEISGGTVFAIGIDRSKQKVERLKENIKRLGHKITVLLFDSTDLPSRYPDLKATKLIVDPPCSDLGRRPKWSFLLTNDTLRNLVILQRKILKAASKILAPEGAIAYSTCTLTIDENEDVIYWARKELGLEPIEPSAPLPTSEVTGFPLCRFMPTEIDGPGFFIAVLKKK